MIRIKFAGYSAILSFVFTTGLHGLFSLKAINDNFQMSILRLSSFFTFSLTLGDYIIPCIIGTSKFFIGRAVYTHQGVAGNVFWNMEGMIVVGEMLMDHMPIPL